VEGLNNRAKLPLELRTFGVLEMALHPLRKYLSPSQNTISSDEFGKHHDLYTYPPYSS
jgi:hypothetical protein